MKIRKIHKKSSSQKLKVAAYCRVSTSREIQEDSFETQIQTYTHLIQANPAWTFSGIYTDEKSGLSDRREGFQRMIADALDGKIQYILVKSISRFSRNIVDCREYLGLLQRIGVTVYFEQENLISTSPDAAMMLSLMAAIAQDESRSNSENHRWAIRRRQARGEYRLGNRQILGYDADDLGNPLPNGDAWIVRKIFEWFVAGQTIAQIAEGLKALGAQSLRRQRPLTHSNIRYILQNEVYAGDRLLQKRPSKNYLTHRPDIHSHCPGQYLSHCHVPIIDRTTWEKSQARLSQMADERARGLLRKHPRAHPLSGLIYCADCQMAFARRTFIDSKSKAAYKAWECKGRMKKSSSVDNAPPPHCAAPILRESDIISAIAQKAHKSPMDPALLLDIAQISIGAEGMEIIFKKNPSIAD